MDNMNMFVYQFVYELNKNGVLLWIESGNLKYRLVEDIKEKSKILDSIKAHKSEIISFLELNCIKQPKFIQPQA